MPVAANDNIATDAPLRLAHIIPLAFPHGGITVSGLRKEAARGRLMIMRIAGKDFTTLQAIEEMKQACRVPANLPASGYVQPTKIAPRSGSSSMAASNSAQAAVSMIVQELKKR
ncbi:UNVERIFIED_ORG: hypothetical protein BTE55_12395 [Rhizobium sophorae]